jgi:hypothetical protein
MRILPVSAFGIRFRLFRQFVLPPPYFAFFFAPKGRLPLGQIHGKGGRILFNV